MRGALVLSIPDPGPQYASVCPNCFGSKLVMVYEVGKGPFKTPVGKCKWLDIEGKEGWYQGELFTDTCPVCKGTDYWVADQAPVEPEQEELFDGVYRGGE